MILAIKTILFIALIFIFIQDLKERKVYLGLLLLTGGIMGFLHFYNSVNTVFVGSIGINIMVIFVIISILYFYSSLKLKKPINNSLGLGDVFFFLVFAVGFSTESFLILFTFSLIFSLIFYLAVKSRMNYKSVPLAGLQALFISLIFVINWMFNFVNFYAL